MNQLLILTEKDGKLGFLRNWDIKHSRGNYAGDKEARLQKETNKMIERGMPLAHAKRLAKLEFSPGLNPLHDRLQQAGGYFNSSGGSLGMKTWRYRFSRPGAQIHTRKTARFLAEEFIADDEIELEFSEGIIAQDFKIRLFFKTGLLYLNQCADRIQLSVIGDESAETFVARDYPSLLKKYPGPVNRHFLQLLENIGFEEPLSLANADVKAAALEVLEAAANDEMRVQALLESLVADSLSERDEAAKELKEGYYKWQGLIGKFKPEIEFDDIAKKKFKKMVATAPGTDEQDFVNSMDLVNNRGSLLGLLKCVDEEESGLVVSRLQEVTGESFGYDIGKWTKLIDPESLADQEE